MAQDLQTHKRLITGLCPLLSPLGVLSEGSWRPPTRPKKDNSKKDIAVIPAAYGPWGGRLCLRPGIPSPSRLRRRGRGAVPGFCLGEPRPGDGGGKVVRGAVAAVAACWRHTLSPSGNLSWGRGGLTLPSAPPPAMWPRESSASWRTARSGGGGPREPLLLEKLPASRDTRTAPEGQDQPGSAFSGWIYGRVSPNPRGPAAPRRRGRTLGSGNRGATHAPGQSPQTHSASWKYWNPTVTGCPDRV